MKINFALCAPLAAAGLLGSALAVDKPISSTITANPASAGGGVEVGIAGRDGVHVSGGEAFVTRNGATEKLVKDLILPSGVIAQPDGTVLLPSGTKATLRGSQLLTLDGEIVEVPRDPSVNPGDPRSGGVPGKSNIRGSGIAGGSAGMSVAVGNPPGSSRSPIPDRPNGGGSVFLGSDGQPFMGLLNPDGTITTSTGQVITPDGIIRSVTFGPDGTATVGTLNANGTVTRADGTLLYPDGSVRSSTGTMITPPTTSAGTSTTTQGTTQTPSGRGNGDQQVNPASPQYGSPSGAATGSPNNAGTINNGNGNPGAPSVGGGTSQTNNGVTTGRTGTSGTGANSSGGTTRGTNGSSGGAAAGGGASGAGGAPGGAAGGASR